MWFYLLVVFLCFLGTEICTQQTLKTYHGSDNVMSNCFYLCISSISPPLAAEEHLQQNESSGCSNQISQQNLITTTSLAQSGLLQVDRLELTAGMRQALCN